MKIKSYKEFNIPNTDIIVEKGDTIELIEEKESIDSINSFLKSMNEGMVSLSYNADFGKTRNNLLMYGKFKFKPSGSFDAMISVLSDTNNSISFSAKDFNKNIETEFDRGIFTLKLTLDKKAEAVFVFSDYINSEDVDFYG